ncbi:MAG: alanine racemase [Paracoccaceae bacterium]|nr:alanine racemase [Paracoccaceae bacterium]
MTAATLTIDLEAISDNWHALDALSGDSTATGAVIKANAYGLGVARVAEALRDAGVTSFFVAEAREGLVLRRSVGDDAEIFVFSGHMAGDANLLERANLIPLLNTPAQIARHFQSLPKHPFGIQLDTGMNRLGMEAAEFAALRDDILAAGPALVMSHLACADDPNHPQNAAQLAAFREMTDGIDVRRSLAATGGILLGKEYHFDLTRPGIGLYGGLPFTEARPVVRLSLPVIQTREVRKGETVGYSATWTAERDSIIATLAGGYADGLIRALSGRALLWDDDTPCNLVGRVSMDLLTVDVTDLDDIPETLDILCDMQTVDDLAEMAGTIGYEILTGLGARYKRVYKG